MKGTAKRRVYLRHKIARKNGRTHTYWHLVRSVRHGSKVRQETVAYLGELDKEGRARARALAASLGRPLDDPRQGMLFEEEATEAIPVDLKKLRVERGRGFGDAWLGWTLWRMLRLDDLFKGLLPEGREDVPYSTVVAILTIARLCDPSSELHVAEDWFRRSALGDLLGVSEEKINDDRLYRALDRALPFKIALERHLKERFGEIFNAPYDLLLYDVTSTYFEGEAAANPMAKRGHSRDHRPDCKQVTIGLVVTRDGLPLGYEVFDGNRVDVTTVEEIVEAMEAKYGRADRVWVMDRGMVSEDNIAFLKERGARYLVGTPKAQLRRFEREIRDKDWREVREGLEVKLCPSPDGAETFILCRSKEREAKERAMHERFAARIEKALQGTETRLAKGRRPASRTAIERGIGRLLGRNTRAAGLFEIDVVEDETRGSRLRLTWRRRSDWADWATLSEGCYLLRSNVSDWSAEDLWRTYVQLSQAEDAFRVQKSDLRIRPVWHQKADRVKAHILICFLAYALWKTLEQWQRRAGLGASPRTVIEEMRRIESTDVVVPTQDGRELRLRCVVRPDKAQKVLLERLGLDLPERLRVPSAFEAM